MTHVETLPDPDTPTSPSTISRLFSPDPLPRRASITWVDRHPSFLLPPHQEDPPPNYRDGFTDFSFLVKLLQLLISIVCTGLYSVGILLVRHDITSQLLPYVVFASYMIITSVIVLSYVLGQKMAELLTSTGQVGNIAASEAFHHAVAPLEGLEPVNQPRVNQASQSSVHGCRQIRVFNSLAVILFLVTGIILLVIWTEFRQKMIDDIQDDYDGNIGTNGANLCHQALSVEPIGNLSCWGTVIKEVSDNLNILLEEEDVYVDVNVKMSTLPGHLLCVTGVLSVANGLVYAADVTYSIRRTLKLM
uniref:(California timema) hypothetical protein n=1 Tax=Timema californicum TaxID=61474 RepID=A0A7R9P882_TIMCA|nr:unnamed protein product [Timema californicum]